MPIVAVPRPVRRRRRACSAGCRSARWSSEGLGADPISTATDGGLGLVSMTAGIALMLVGRAWARALVRAAARDDEDSAVGHPRRARGGTS